MQEIELNKANWSALFEPFNFFEAYKNYLQVDIIAEDDEDLRLWKGWVESRLRQLTLKVIYDFVLLLRTALVTCLVIILGLYCIIRVSLLW
jgi:poly(A) polymerase Pap1